MSSYLLMNINDLGARASDVNSPIDINLPLFGVILLNINRKKYLFIALQDFIVQAFLFSMF